MPRQFEWRRVSRGYRIASSRYHNKRKRLEDELEAMKDKYPRWIKNLIEPIAEAVASHLGRDYDLMGPFGLCHEISIYLYRKGSERDNDDDYACLCFTAGDLEKGELNWRDETKNTARFASGTIGSMNGMNHPSEPVPLDADLQWFLDRLVWSEKSSVALKK